MTMTQREVLIKLANDAFEVLNWARRYGLKRDAQVNEVVEAFQKAMTDAKVKIVEEV